MGGGERSPPPAVPDTGLAADTAADKRFILAAVPHDEDIEEEMRGTPGPAPTTLDLGGETGTPFEAAAVLVTADSPSSETRGAVREVAAGCEVGAEPDPHLSVSEVELIDRVKAAEGNPIALASMFTSQSVRGTLDQPSWEQRWSLLDRDLDQHDVEFRLLDAYIKLYGQFITASEAQSKRAIRALLSRAADALRVSYAHLVAQSLRELTGPHVQAARHKHGNFVVFLSHNGLQKPYVETDLYPAVRDMALRGDERAAFFDKRSLQPGDMPNRKMLWAALSCRVAVVTLSKDFFRSKWCLRELAILGARLQIRPSAAAASFGLLPDIYEAQDIVLHMPLPLAGPLPTGLCREQGDVNSHASALAAECQRLLHPAPAPNAPPEASPRLPECQGVFLQSQHKHVHLAVVLPTYRDMQRLLAHWKLEVAPLEDSKRLRFAQVYTGEATWDIVCLNADPRGRPLSVCLTHYLSSFLPHRVLLVGSATAEPTSDVVYFSAFADGRAQPDPLQFDGTAVVPDASAPQDDVSGDTDAQQRALFFDACRFMEVDCLGVLQASAAAGDAESARRVWGKVADGIQAQIAPIFRRVRSRADDDTDYEQRAQDYFNNFVGPVVQFLIRTQPTSRLTVYQVDCNMLDRIRYEGGMGTLCAQLRLQPHTLQDDRTQRRWGLQAGCGAEGNPVLTNLYDFATTVNNANRDQYDKFWAKFRTILASREDWRGWVMVEHLDPRMLSPTSGAIACG